MCRSPKTRRAETNTLMASETAALDQAANQSATRDNQFRFVINVALRRWKMIAIITLVASIGYGMYGMLKR